MAEMRSRTPKDDRKTHPATVCPPLPVDAEWVARRRAERRCRGGKLLSLEPAVEVAGDGAPVRPALLITERRQGAAPRAQRTHFQLDQRPDLGRRFFVGREEEKAVGNGPLGDPSERIEFGAAGATRTPVGGKGVQNLTERERLWHPRLQSDDPRRALTLQNAVDDHLRQRARRAELVERRSRAATEKLDVRLIRKWARAQQGQDRVGNGELFSLECTDEQCQRPALRGTVNRVRRLHAI